MEKGLISTKTTSIIGRLTMLVHAIALSGCATLSDTSPVSQTSESTPVENPELILARDQIQKLQSKVQEMEARLTAMNEKFNLRLEPPAKSTSTIQPIRPPLAADNSFSVVSPKSDEASDRYREAKILFDAQRWGDSVVEFTDFLKAYPRHPFASAAQFHIGMAYFKQKEYRIAEEEWNRSLITYPRGQYTADTIAGLIEVSHSLEKADRAAYFQQKLLMLFPNSPQASSIATKTNNAISPPPTLLKENPVEPMEDDR